MRSMKKCPFRSRKAKLVAIHIWIMAAVVMTMVRKRRMVVTISNNNDIGGLLRLKQELLV